ncbi:1-deoxy-D-xylulose-5-phosphate synthase N-terminal domain-containing protein [Limosilactobacillus fermentum]|uniref:1-deoxy-D-xylulose-5-phosphate synthase N-terminal domain-containing protein n=1 Tax=Limosilactobacillus fermentum TaxID=1613 RepID=UPI00215C9414|nr:1-deoxy-D-xylulose-5-phosphate synthase N-terminal domain-containing protein [Limosilactobacillus fermentum]
MHSSKDVKQLTNDQLHTLVDEARAALLQKLSVHGGHNGPNLGVVEMTVALHAVFDSPTDKIIYDVSHQSYVHKMLTGRAQAFLDPAHYDDVSGYTNPKESDDDFFSIGHTSTSLALASGFIKARDVLGNHENIVAVIGDGSLSGGLAYEGLNNVVTENSNAIVIVNDNDQSIAKNPTGGIYTALRKLRESNGQAEDNFFTALGYEYHYLADGNDLDQLIALFKSVKDTDHPVLLHVQTEKGHGFAPAEANHEKFHAGGPIDLKTGDYKGAGQPAGETYDAVLSDLVFNKLKQDRSVIALSSGTPMIIFNQEQRQADTTDYGDLNKNQVVHQGSKVAIFGVGNLLGLAKQAAAKLAEEGVDATVINPRYLTRLDTELLDQLQADHQVVVTLEDGILEGGYGQTIASYLGDSAVRVQNYGLQKAYPDRYDVNELLAQNGLTADNIAQQALKALN